jgi:hypothetical protein
MKGDRLTRFTISLDWHGNVPNICSALGGPWSERSLVRLAYEQSTRILSRNEH